jgi:purine-binding chemotaxis protein CheW
MSIAAQPDAVQVAVAATTRFCTFYVGDLFFGLEVLKVQEVLRYLDITRVPLAPPVIEGLINLRGQIVTAIDMRRRLGLPARDPGVAPMNLVMRIDDTAVSLLVDQIGDVLEVSCELFEQVPVNVERDYREVIQGVYKLEGRLLLSLDSEKLLNFANTN